MLGSLSELLIPVKGACFCTLVDDHGSSTAFDMSSSGVTFNGDAY